jgi:hypothetical protein
MNVKEYKTLYGNPIDVDKKVNVALAQGYQLYGNPYSVDAGGTGMACQAVVREHGTPPPTPGGKASTNAGVSGRT